MQHSNGKLEVITDEQWANEIIDRENERETQREQVKEEVNKKFNEQLDTLTEENADNVVLSLGMPSNILLSAGVENKSLKLYGNKIIKKAKKHGFKIKDLRDLPRAVANPIAVFNNYNKEGNRSILTELQTQQGNILVGIEIGKEGVDIDFNIVKTVFGKGDNKVIDWIEKGLATYINKEKALNYLHHSAPIAEALSNSRLNSVAKIIQNFENPQIKHEKKLQEKRVYHGSGAEFTEFDHSKMSTGEGNQAHGWGTYVAVDRKTSEAYTEYLGKYFCKCKGIYYESLGELARYITNKVYDYLEENDLDDSAPSWTKWQRYAEVIKDAIINSRSKENLLEEIAGAFTFTSDTVRGHFYDTLKEIGLDKVEYGKQQGFLYTAEIPNRTKNRYLDEDKVNKELNQKIIDAFVKDHTFIENELKQLVDRTSKWKDYTGKGLYEALSKELGSDELSSKFLNSIGIVGIHYNGRLDGECYVIFNEKDLQIKNKEKIQLFKTSKGECYGFTVGGKIYIDTRIAKADTPIHEFTHLWARALRENNPKEWKNIVALMKNRQKIQQILKLTLQTLLQDVESSKEKGKKLFVKIITDNNLTITDFIQIITDFILPITDFILTNSEKNLMNSEDDLGNSDIVFKGSTIRKKRARKRKMLI
jgi:hypothetical protein